MSTMPSINDNERPTSTIMTSTMNDIHTNVPDRISTSQSTATSDMGTSSIMQTGGTNPPYAERPSTPINQDRYTPSTGGTMSTGNEYTNTVDGNRYPTTERLPTTDRYPGGGSSNTDRGSSTMPYGNTNTQGGGGTSTWTSMNTYGHGDISTNEISRPTYPPTYDNRQTPGYHYPYPPQYDHKYNYYQDVYPTYSYPMLYEHTYPMPNSPGYAPNVPSSSYGPPDYYSNTQYSSTSGGTSPMDRPREPSPAYGVPTSQTIGSRPGSTGSTYMGNGYSNADEIRKPTMTPQGGYNPSKYPEGKYNTSTTPKMVPYIRTYFNPDDYYPNSKRE